MTGKSEDHTSLDRPLVIDLDGTLTRTDLLVESLMALLRKNALYLLALPLWLFRGRAAFKHEIAQRVDLAPEALPYEKKMLEFAREQKALGRTLVLATGSNRKYAEEVANHLGIFDTVLASDDSQNLTGAHKKERLVERYGEKGFDYAGNARVDLAVWSHCRRPIVVARDARLRQDIADRCPPPAYDEALFIDVAAPTIRDYWRALRPHQWVKNLLVFVPLLMAHELFGQSLGAGLAAFVAMCFCASSVYVLNDMVDLPDDRLHPTKRLRPFAAGLIPVTHGFWMAAALLGLAIAVTATLPSQFQWTLLIYYSVTLAYSLRLKRIAILDVIVLAGLHTLRLLAGATATGIAVSSWLQGFSMFLFLSLALVKRYSEQFSAASQGRTPTSGRDYKSTDLDTLSQLGITSGLMAVLVLALYISSEKIRTLYARPDIVWLLCPVILYWISRVWFLTRRGQVHEDPIVFALRDRASYLVAAISIFIMWLAT